MNQLLTRPIYINQNVFCLFLKDNIGPGDISLEFYW